MSRAVFKDKIFIAGMLAYLAFVGSVWALHFHATIPDLKVTVFDQISRPGERVAVTAKIEVDGPGPFKRDKEALAVEFAAAGATLGTATTADEGIAALEIDAPANKGITWLRVTPVDRGSYRLAEQPDGGALFVVGTETPIIVCDIDGTITAGDEWDWDTLVRSEGPAALPGAADVLTLLARSNAIVFLTARDDGLLNRTRAWLDIKGFPRSPVLCRDWRLGSLSKTGEFKTRILTSLMERFPNLRWGIGNTAGDCQAYRAIGLPHVTLTESHCEGGAVRCEPVKDWTALGAFLERELAGDGGGK
ncbi:MAG: hypothetical protein L0Z55_10090 [Planctomycetes bacterium]|nr:hypothetical protein [Planctomycetota bacterium]